MVYITISTGIGGGIIANGQLLHGIRTSAGEIGHHTVLPNGPRCGCGSRGCLEALASGTSIARRAREALAEGRSSIMPSLAGGDPTLITTEIVVEAVRQGDGLAQQIWDQTIDYLATGIANVIVTLAPEMVVIGGGVSEVGDLLFQPLRQALNERVCIVPIERVQIVHARLGIDVGVVGALAVGIDHLGGN
jgi:glucokinase